VSSLASGPLSVLSPLASAAISRARLVMLLEPGTRITASKVPRGRISRASGKRSKGCASSSGGVKLAKLTPLRGFGTIARSLVFS
jgi:hypothetical protein